MYYIINPKFDVGETFWVPRVYKVAPIEKWEI